MWAMNTPRRWKIFSCRPAMGFCRMELNHQLNSAMLAGIDLAASAFSSIHEPCPADVSTTD